MLVEKETIGKIGQGRLVRYTLRSVASFRPRSIEIFEIKVITYRPVLRNKPIYELIYLYFVETVKTLYKN